MDDKRNWTYIIILFLILSLTYSTYLLSKSLLKEEEIFIPTEETKMSDYKVIIKTYYGYEGELSYDNKVVSIWGATPSDFFWEERTYEQEFKAYQLNSVLVKDVDVLANISVEVYKDGIYLDGVYTYGRNNYVYLEF